MATYEELLKDKFRTIKEYKEANAALGALRKTIDTEQQAVFKSHETQWNALMAARTTAKNAMDAAEAALENGSTGV